MSAHVIITSIFGAWHACKPLFGSSVATCWLAYSDISINEKKAREKSRKKSDIAQFGGWRDSFSSALCFVL